MTEMIALIYEKLRGIDRWPEVMATVLSAPISTRSSKGKLSGWSSDTKLRWLDFHGNLQTAHIKVSDNSPLFQLYKGSTVKIRYNPARLSSFYLRQRVQDRLYSFFLFVLFLGTVAGLEWLRIIAFGPTRR